MLCMASILKYPVYFKVKSTLLVDIIKATVNLSLAQNETASNNFVVSFWILLIKISYQACISFISVYTHITQSRVLSEIWSHNPKANPDSKLQPLPPNFRGCCHFVPLSITWIHPWIPFKLAPCICHDRQIYIADWLYLFLWSRSNQRDRNAPLSWTCTQSSQRSLSKRLQIAIGYCTVEWQYRQGPETPIINLLVLKNTRYF